MSSTNAIFFEQLWLALLQQLNLDAASRHLPFEILSTHPAPVFLLQKRHLESMLRWLTIYPSRLDSSLLSGRNHFEWKSSPLNS